MSAFYSDSIEALTKLSQDDLCAILNIQMNKLHENGFLDKKIDIELLEDLAGTPDFDWIDIAELPLPKEIDFLKNITASPFRDYPDYVEFTDERFYCYALLLKLPITVMMMVYANCDSLSLEYFKKTYIRGVLHSSAKKANLNPKKLSAMIKEDSFKTSTVYNIFNGTKELTYQEFQVLAGYLNIPEDTVINCGLCFGSTESFMDGAICEEHFSLWLGKSVKSEELEAILAEKDEETEALERKIDVYDDMSSNSTTEAFQDFLRSLGVSIKSTDNRVLEVEPKDYDGSNVEGQYVLGYHELELKLPDETVVMMDAAQLPYFIKEIADYIEFKLSKYCKKDKPSLADGVKHTNLGVVTHSEKLPKSVEQRIKDRNKELGENTTQDVAVNVEGQLDLPF